MNFRTPSTEGTGPCRIALLSCLVVTAFCAALAVVSAPLASRRPQPRSVASAGRLIPAFGALPPRALCRNAHWQGADLSQQWFAGADCTEAQLQGARLNGANFRGANLTGAQMQDAIMWYVDLDSAHLQKANLGHADLARASLRQASLENADLRRAIFKAANLTGANLLGARMRDANFTAANLQGRHADWPRNGWGQFHPRQSGRRGPEPRRFAPCGRPYRRPTQARQYRLRHFAAAGHACCPRRTLAAFPMTIRFRDENSPCYHSTGPARAGRRKDYVPEDFRGCAFPIAGSAAARARSL